MWEKGKKNELDRHGASRNQSMSTRAKTGSQLGEEGGGVADSKTTSNPFRAFSCPQ